MMSKRVSLWATGLCALLLTASCAEPNVGERRAGVIPAPVELTKGQGLFAIGPRTEIGYADESLKGMAAQLSEEIERASGMKLAFASDKESNCKIFLELVDPSMFADLRLTAPARRLATRAPSSISSRWRKTTFISRHRLWRVCAEASPH